MFKIETLSIENSEQSLFSDQEHPTLSFSMQSDTPEVGFDHAEIRFGETLITTKNQLGISYQGPALLPHSIYEVKVKAFDRNGNSDEKTVLFKTAKMKEPWTGRWITETSYPIQKNVSPAPVEFIKHFQPKKPVKRALLYSTALGIYFVNLNGERVGSDYFAPGLTSYTHQIQYQCQDITDLLKENNTLVATVGAGWAVGRFSNSKKTQISADRITFLAEIRLEYADGTVEVIATDTTWRASLDGPYIFADFYDGEIFDATRLQGERNEKTVSLTAPRKSPALICQYGPTVKAFETLRPVSVQQSPSGEWIYDFGQNFAGVISFRVQGHLGQTLTFRHAEVMHEGELFVKSLRTAKALMIYHCREGEQTYSPQLTYMGFRYVDVSGIAPEDIVLEAKALYSDIKENGSFECSDPLLNRLQQNIVWSGKSNFVDIPTDCPQRDERVGWTGDLAVFAPVACYNFDMSRFLKKWLLDMKCEQGRGGGIPMTVPIQGDVWPVLATSCWGDSCITVPYDEYLARGDLELLRQQYPVMKKFLKAASWWSKLFSIGKYKRHIWKYPFHFGDWCAPDVTIKQWLNRGPWIATAFYAHSCRLVATIADLLGETKDRDRLLKLSDTIAQSFFKVFTDGQGKLKREFQTAYVLPIAFHLFDEKTTEAMVGHLMKLLEQSDYHIMTGFTGTPFILFALSDTGHLEEAYKLLLQDTCPSWLYEVKAGGTTIWERWDALRPDGTVNIQDLTKSSDESGNGGMVSFNHYANGAVGRWLYQRLLGIEPLEGGYKTFRFQPLIGKELDYAKGCVVTPYGRIEASWKKTNDQITLDLCVPMGTTAEVVLPNGNKQNVGPGAHQFVA